MVILNTLKMLQCEPMLKKSFLTPPITFQIEHTITFLIQKDLEPQESPTVYFIKHTDEESNMSSKQVPSKCSFSFKKLM